MTSSAIATTVQEWIAHDPDPQSAKELSELSPEELDERFSRPLTFGTAGLRGPMRAGPDGMNLAVVVRATWGVAKVLKDRGREGSQVIVGRDARHRSDEFACAAAEVLAGQGFQPILILAAVPTPVVAFAVRHMTAAAGIQITASHNPKTDNGYKVYFGEGLQIVSPTDREIERAITDAPPADQIPRVPVDTAGMPEIQAYIQRAALVRRTSDPVRVAVTPLHGVGGDYLLDALVRAKITDIHVVESQFAPDPEFPTVAFPNPEEPGATDALLELAADVDADIAIALDPDADRCAVGVPTADGWRMLSGDETGWLLGDYLLSQVDPGDVMAQSMVASTVVSSRMLAAIAAAHGAQHVETLTGFKWLARADVEPPGRTLVYAYEEAIGHCVDPAAVRDKDGITAAVLACDLVAALRAQGRTILDALDELARRHGVHTTVGVHRHLADTDEVAAAMSRLRDTPPDRLCGYPVTVTDLLSADPPMRTDAVVLSGGDDATSVRVAVRPSGTESKFKSYIEIRRAVDTDGDIATARAQAERLRDEVAGNAAQW